MLFRSLKADLTGFDLSWCNLVASILAGADLRGANLANADLSNANLQEARMDGAYARKADFFNANLSLASLTGANLQEANLICSVLVGANLADAEISGSKVYGVAAWDANLTRLHQDGLIITPPGEHEITVDQIEMAQFLNLVVRNSKLQDAFNTLTSKLVLLLGRFSKERKEVLETFRDALRREGLVPVIFDFPPPSRRDTTETVTSLATLACFVLADITEARSIPQELHAIVPDFPSLPVTLIELASDEPYAMVDNILRRPNVSGIYKYTDKESQLQLVKDHVAGWRANLNVTAAT